MGVVLSGPAAGHEALHAPQHAHGVARGPEGGSRIAGRTALAFAHVGDGIHRLEARLALDRAVAHAQHEHRRAGEALSYVGHHLLDLAAVAVVGVYARLHDVESVLEHHQVVAQHCVHLGVDRGVGPEHRLPVVASHRVVVDRHAAPFEGGAVADEPAGAREHLEAQRMDVGRRDEQLPHGGVTLDVEAAAQRVVERRLDAGILRREEEYAGRRHRVESLSGVGRLPARRGPLVGAADPSRDEVVGAQLLGRALPLHDVVGVPTAGLRAHRAAEGRQRRGHRGETRTAAIGALEPFAQVGRQDVALDEGVAQNGDAHRPAAEQRLVESLHGAHARRVVVLDGDDARCEAHRVGTPGAEGRVGPCERPLEGGADGVGQRVGHNPFGNLLHVHMELHLVEERGFGLGLGGILEGEQVGEDVGTPQMDAAHALGRNETDPHEHRNEHREGYPAAVEVVFFGLHQSRRPRMRKT